MKFKNYPKNFWLICAALFFFIVSFNLIIPELNAYVSQLHPDGKHLKGLIIFLFSLSAAISRPFSGKLSDTIGRKKVMLIGAVVSTIASLAYTITDVGLFPLFGIILFFFIRFIHGLSAGFLPTGATALVTDILPPDKRGVGMGIWGTFISAGFGAGQILASWITETWNIDVLFMAAAFLSLITIFIVNRLEETLPAPKPYQGKFLKVNWRDIFEKPVMPAATVMFLSTISTGIIFVVAQEISTFLHVNKGYFFGFYVISTILVRLFASSLSDIIGRRKTLLIGLVFLTFSMFLVANSADLVTFTFAGIIFGLSTGVNSPTIFAWTADLSVENRRGIGAGTLFIALEFGIMVGSASTLLTYENSSASIFLTAIIGALFCLIAIAYLLWHLKTRESKT